MFGAIRGLSEAIRMLSGHVRELINAQRETGPAEERLEALERSRVLWEAEVEALVLKAESSFRSASNAESRARTMERHVEKQLGPFAEESEEEPESVPAGDGAGGEEEWVQPLPVAVEADPKARARRLKFG